MADAGRADAPDYAPRIVPDLGPRQARVRDFLLRLADAPPQVLLLEGGTSVERLHAAFFWAAALNCRDPRRPCLACPACVKLMDRAHRDLFVLGEDGGSIKVEEVRNVRAVLGEPPREGGLRVVILPDAHRLTLEAGNALLKSLEEPRPGTSFVLLAPQRERLLPTLVSRSWVLTLAWPEAGACDSLAGDERMREWSDALCLFLRTGRGWFERTGGRGAVDRDLAQGLVLHCQAELIRAMCGCGGSPLAEMFLAEGPEAMLRADQVLDGCQRALLAGSGAAGVSPALVLDWLATCLYRGD